VEFENLYDMDMGMLNLWLERFKADRPGRAADDLAFERWMRWVVELFAVNIEREVEIAFAREFPSTAIKAAVTIDDPLPADMDPIRPPAYVVFGPVPDRSPTAVEVAMALVKPRMSARVIVAGTLDQAMMDRAEGIGGDAILATATATVDHITTADIEKARAAQPEI
jgi:hypothetical protein